MINSCYAIKVLAGANTYKNLLLPKVTLRKHKRKDIKMEFGEKLKQTREAQGMTQQTLADKLFVTRQAVSRWECGARYPDLLTAKCISDILHISLDELLSKEEIKDYAEKQAVIEEHKAGRIQTCIYGIIAILYFISVFQFGVSGIRIMMGKAEYQTTISILILGCKAIALFGVSLWGFRKSLEKDTTPKIVGIYTSLYYVFWGTYRIHIGIQNEMIGKSIGTAFAIIDFLLAICVFLYFCLGKEKMYKLVYIITTLGFVINVGAVIMLAWISVADISRSIYRTAPQMLIEKVACVIMSLLIIYQLKILQRKRRMAKDCL